MKAETKISQELGYSTNYLSNLKQMANKQYDTFLLLGKGDLENGYHEFAKLADKITAHFSVLLDIYDTRLNAEKRAKFRSIVGASNFSHFRNAILKRRKKLPPVSLVLRLTKLAADPFLNDLKAFK